MDKFNFVSEKKPKGDQPQAIEKLIEGLESGHRFQTLLGVTGSGKTFTVANVVAQVNRPTLLVSHNKILAAQLCNELRSYFPENAVEYFVSYYDYYQPEAYIPHANLYIEKDAHINETIDKYRHAATSSVLTRRDVIIVASVSCIYGIGSPDTYKEIMLHLSVGTAIERDSLLRRLIDMQYIRNDDELKRGVFRLKGDVLTIYPADGREGYKIEFWDDEITKITKIDIESDELLGETKDSVIFPATHYVIPQMRLKEALVSIEEELHEREKELRSEDKILEADRLVQRTNYDLEMISELGYCTGIENYSRHFDGRKPGEPPYTIIEYFPSDFLTIIDESHVTLPQLKAMLNGDRARKKNLIDHGFRLPSASDNRPLSYAEFWERMGNVIFASATPDEEEMKISRQVVEQLVRPTGLVDPELILKPARTQVKDLLGEIKKNVEKGERTLVTTLTKRMAEDLTYYLIENGIKARYMHSDIDTLERVDIIYDLRIGKFDVLVGINLLREGLDLPEVSLVAILDADNEGFLRSATTLIQTIGRAARNVHGKSIIYCDKITSSIKYAVDETERRRKKQIEYNNKKGIIPTTIYREITKPLEEHKVSEESSSYSPFTKGGHRGIMEESIAEIPLIIATFEEKMKEAADNLDFERAAEYRDRIKELAKKMEIKSP